MKQKNIFTIAFLVVLSLLLFSNSSAADEVLLWLSVPAQVYPGETVEAWLSVSEVPRVRFTLSRVENPAEYIKENRKESFFDVGTWRPDRPFEQRERWQNLKHGFFQSIRRLASRLLPDRTKEYLRELLGISGPLYPRLIEISPADYQRGTVWLKTWEEKVRYPANSRYAYTSYQIPALEEGMYLLTASGGGREARVLFSVSRFAFSLKKEGDRHLLFLQDAMTGEPQAGVPVQVIDQDEVLTEGITDPLGIWSENFSAQSGEVAIIAGENGRYAFLSAWSYPMGAEELEAFLFTERPLYRPGQPVFFRGILRLATPEGYLTPPAGETVVVRLTDYTDNEYGRHELQSNQFGSISASFDLPQALREGGYLLEMIWREQSFYRYLDIENYEKPAFEIDFSSERDIYANREEMVFHLKASYYSGEPLTPARYRYRVVRYPIYSWSRGSQAEMVLEEEGELDDIGQTEIVVVPEVEENAFRYEVTAQVFDPAYRVVEKTLRVRVLPGDYVLVLEPERYFGATEKPYRWTITARDAQDQLVTVDKVFASVKELTWNEQQQEYDEQLVQFFTVSLPEGQETIEIILDKGGYYLLELLSQDGSGNRIRSIRRFYITGTGLYVPSQGVEMTLDKPEYQPGENARVLIVPPVGSGPFHFLFSVEGRTMHHFQVRETEGPVELVFPVKSAHALGCFVTITAFSRGIFYNETLEVPVNPERELEVDVIFEKEVYRPGESGNILIRVLGRDGLPRPAEVSLAIVDQAIFDLSWIWWDTLYEHFYGYHYNRVYTMSSQYTSFYGQGIRAMDARLQMKMGNGMEGEVSLRSYFPDTLLWEGSLITDEQGEITVPFRNAGSLTRWRVEVRAVSEDYFGETVSHFRTSSPFALRVTPPPFLFRGDDLVSEATLWNELDPQAVRLDLMTSSELSGTLDTHEVTIGRDQNLVFPLNITSLEPGVAWFRLYARGSAASDGIEQRFPVKETGVSVQKKHSVLYGEVPVELDFFFDPDGYTVFPEVSITLFADQAERLLSESEAMFRYPYRCSEQIASQIISVLAVTIDTDADWVKQIPDLVREGLFELYSLQNDDGGWGWWRYGDSQVFHTAHVLMAFWLAVENGYPVSQPAVDRAVYYLKWAMMEDVTTFERNLARYVLSQLYDEELNGWNEAGMDITQFDDTSLALEVLLAVEEKEQLSGLLVQRGKTFGDTMFYGERNPDRPWEDDRVLSTAWATLALLDSGYTKEANLAYLWLWRSLEGDRYLNTVEQAYFLLVSRLFEHQTKSGQNPAFQVTINGRKVADGQADPDRESAQRITIAENLVEPGLNRVRVEGKGLFMVTLDVIGFMHKPPEDGLFTVKRQYWKLRSTRQDDGTLVFSREPVETLMPGDEVLCELMVTSPYAFENLVIEDGMPAGFELVRSWNQYPLAGETPTDDFWYNQTVSLHDHQPVIFVSRLKAGENVIRYLLRVRDKGVFSVPPARAYLMYHPEVYGYSEGTIVEIGR